MLGNMVCWVIALALILAKSNAAIDFKTKLVFAMGFIFLGILSKAVDVYHATHKIDDTKEESEREC